MVKSGLEAWPPGQRLGLLGGTFDPVHHGHLAVATAVREALQLDGVIFLPAAQPPHKQFQAITPFADRLAMLAAAVAGHPSFVVSALEGQRSGPSYSVDTLLRLRRELDRAVRLFFVVGMDAFVEIGSWKDYRQLPLLADLVVIDRPRQLPPALVETIRDRFPDYQWDGEEGAWRAPAFPGLIRPLAMEPVPISSTEVRRRARGGGELAALVPPAVAEYIRGRGLYR